MTEAKPYGMIPRWRAPSKDPTWPHKGARVFAIWWTDRVGTVIAVGPEVVEVKWDDNVAMSGFIATEHLRAAVEIRRK